MPLLPGAPAIETSRRGTATPRALKMRAYFGSLRLDDFPAETWNPLAAVVERSPGTANGRRPLVRVAELRDADAAVLPLTLRPFTIHVGREELYRSVEVAREAGKPLLVWHSGDLIPRDLGEHVMVLQHGLHRSQRAPNQWIAPYFVDDPLAGLEAEPRGLWSPAPAVGFCGFAKASALKLAVSFARNVRSNVRTYRNHGLFHGPALMPAVALRMRAIRELERSRAVQTKFVVREQYKAGLRNSLTAQSRETQEFFENILSTDYTLCVRGYGNWSVRLYETLACGRIPVIVDTDIALPLESKIDWRRIAVWVRPEELGRIGDKVAEYHGQFDEAGLRERQRECRQIWERYLTPEGFARELPELFAQEALGRGVLAAGDPVARSGAA